MSKINNLVFVMFLAVLTGCVGVSSTDGVRAPEQQRAGFLGLGVADEIKVQREVPFQGVERVVIGSFKVGFVHGKVESRHAGGGLTHTGANVAAGIKLTGVDAAQMQAITDAAYADFVARMTAAGYDLVDRAELRAQPDFARAKPEAAPQHKTASFFGDQTQMSTFAPASHGDLYWFEGEADKSGGFGFANATTAALAYYGKTGIKVLSVYYVIDFAGAGGYGGQFATRASVEVGQSLTLAPDGGITLLGGEGRSLLNQSGSIKLGQPLYADEQYGTIVQTTSNTAKGVETALNVVSTLARTSTRQRRDFEVQADAERYASLSQDLVTQANTRLVERMASLR